MATVTKVDTDGTKGLLGRGEFGYDNYEAGGDAGRIYYGSGLENVPVAKKEEVDNLISGATDIEYDGTVSELTATTVKEAIDEIDGVVDGVLDGTEDIMYDNSVSGLTATKVKTALDELSSITGDLDKINGTEGTTKRYDKLLAALDIVEMEKNAEGKLGLVRYSGDNDSSVFYRDVMSYNVELKLIEVKHYYGVASLTTESGKTTLTYVGGNLNATTYEEN